MNIQATPSHHYHNPLTPSFGADKIRVMTKNALGIIIEDFDTKDDVGLFKVCDAMTGRSNTRWEFLFVSEKCSKALLDVPVLRDAVKAYEAFIASGKKTTQQIQDWFAGKIQQIGPEVEVPSVKVNDADLFVDFMTEAVKVMSTPQFQKELAQGAPPDPAGLIKQAAALNARPGSGQ